MFPRVQVEVVPGAGHWVHADQPAAFVALLKRVLKPQAAVRRVSADSTTP
jgi:pimeloyl-ACP methyl ester carboxylesterase